MPPLVLRRCVFPLLPPRCNQFAAAARGSRTPLPTCESALEWAFRGACATNDEQQRKGMQIQIK